MLRLENSITALAPGAGAAVRHGGHGKRSLLCSVQLCAAVNIVWNAVIWQAGLLRYKKTGDR